MIQFIHHILLGIILFYSLNGITQSMNSIELHFQIYDQGICYPMEQSVKYNSSQHLKTKTVLQSSAYYSTIYAEVISKDTADIKPQINHELQSSSLKFNPNLDYELIIYKYDGFDRAEHESMVIKISKLDYNAQLIIPFKKGEYNLDELKYFKDLDSNTQPNFREITKDKDLKNNLNLDSTAYFLKGDIKAEYYKISGNFPLYFVKEFDSLNKDLHAQGLRLLTNYNHITEQSYQSIWADSDNTKYGYWEYFENVKCVKHEFWAPAMSHQYTYYPSGHLKTSIDLGRSNNSAKYTYYLENGLIIEESEKIEQTRQYLIKSNIYSKDGTLVQINTFKSLNGFTKQDLYKREIFYPSGKIKIEEILQGTYLIKYYNEDGTEKRK